MLIQVYIYNIYLRGRPPTWRPGGSQDIPSGVPPSAHVLTSQVCSRTGFANCFQHFLRKALASVSSGNTLGAAGFLHASRKRKSCAGTERAHADCSSGPLGEHRAPLLLSVAFCFVRHQHQGWWFLLAHRDSRGTYTAGANFYD